MENLETRIEEYKHSFKKQNNKSPSFNQIANGLGIDIKKVWAVMKEKYKRPNKKKRKKRTTESNEYRDKLKFSKKERDNSSYTEQLILDNIQFARNIAHKYKGYGLPFEDLESEAVSGLVIAADKFDPNQGNKFITFAVHWIKYKIRHALTQMNNFIHESNSHKDKIKKIETFQNEFFKKNSRLPCYNEISKKLDLSTSVIERTLNNKINGTFSLNSKINDDNNVEFDEISNIETIHSNYQSPFTETEQAEIYKKLKESLKSLPDVEYNILFDHFWNGMTFKDIGEKYFSGTSPASARFKILKICKKIRNDF